MEGASNDLNIRCVVITAAGDRHFCTGADLRVSVIPVNPGPDDAPDKVLGDVGRNIKRGAQRLIGSIMDCEKPVICAVNGTAAGIGAHIAFASDLVIAAVGELMATTLEWAGRLAESPTRALMLSKWLLNRSLDSNRHGAFEDEAWAQEMASYTQDFQEGVAAFKERRDVQYRGW